MERDFILETKNLSKHFHGIVALNNVNFQVYRGEILGLVGDNGAGKSTLIKIISGCYPPTSGEIWFEGRKVKFENPRQAREAGIETVYQELALCDNLDVSSNFFIGRELYWNFAGFKFLQQRKMDEFTNDIITRTGIKIPSIKRKVNTLSGGQRQGIALGRAVAWGAKLVLLDEPTAALGVREAKEALRLIKNINSRGISVVVVSHNLEHIFEIVDRITVLRLGRIVGTRIKKETSSDEIVSLITGAESQTKEVIR